MINYNFSFLKIDGSKEELKAATEKKIYHLVKKFIHSNVNCDIVFSIKGHISYISCHISGTNRYEAKAEGENMYIALDRLIDKLEKQLRSQKGKSSKKGNVSVKNFDL